MKKGKFQKKKAHASGLKRTALIVLCLVMLGATIGATIAYLQAQTNGVVNTFIPGKVEVEIQETFPDNEVKQNVKVSNPQNTQNVPAYIRAAIVVNWAKKENNEIKILGQVPDSNDFKMIINTTDWTLGSDGYYYYNKGAVAPGASTSNLIIEASQLEDAPVEGYYLSIDILASGVQSMPIDAVTDLWGSAAAGYVSGS